jgi:hypothetical protein
VLGSSSGLLRSGALVAVNRKERVGGKGGATMRVLTSGMLAGVVLVLSACASSTPSAPPSVDVTGRWVGTWNYENPTLGGGQISGTFKQEGSKLAGKFDVTGPVVNNTAEVIGFVSGNELRISQPSSGWFTVTGNQMTGTINGLNVAKITLRKQ